MLVVSFAFDNSSSLRNGETQLAPKGTCIFNSGKCWGVLIRTEAIKGYHWPNEAYAIASDATGK